MTAVLLLQTLLARAEPSKPPSLILTGLTALVAATVGGWLSAFFKKKGEVDAQTRFAADIRDQLAETTRVVKQVEEEIQGAGFVGRTALAYRERQLAELYGPLYGMMKRATPLIGNQHEKRVLPHSR